MEFVSSFKGGDGLRVEESFGDGYVRLRVSEAERRQAKHDIRCVEDAVIEMLRNSRDAGATRIFVASSREADVRTVVVVDDGVGIPPEMHDRVFDARVTSKLDTVHMDRWGVHGRGMALYSIAQNAREARVVDSNTGLGTSMLVSFDTNEIVERADQSTWPTVVQKDGGFEVRGPKNIVRACVEFALEAKDTCNVYVGSPSEAMATMRRRISPSASSVQLFVEEDMAHIHVVERAALAKDAKQMQAISRGLGIEMSERTAHRIVRGQIRALRNVRTQVLGQTAAKQTAITQDVRRSLSLSESDREELAERLSEGFDDIASRYYVVRTSAPKIRSGKGVLTVTFEYAEDE